MGYCETCLLSFSTAAEYKVHLKGQDHRLTEIKFYLKNNRNKLLEDKNGIRIVSRDAITTGVGAVSKTGNSGEELTTTLCIINDNKHDIIFTRCDSLYAINGLQVTDKHGVCSQHNRNRLMMGPGMEYEVYVRFKSEDASVYLIMLMFEFDITPNSPVILREITMNFLSDISKMTSPISPYKRRNNFRELPKSKNILRGVPYSNRIPGNNLEMVLKIPLFAVPKEFFKGSPEKNEPLNNLLKDGLNWENYTEYFKNLIYVEEVQMIVDIRTYDLEGVTMRRCNDRQLLELAVPGLAERRPSVLRGDTVFVRVMIGDKPQDLEIEGYVRAVKEKHIHVAFDRAWVETKFIDKMKFHIRFTFRKYPIQMQQRAVDFVKDLSLKSVVFPTLPVPKIEENNVATIPFYNRKVAENPQQAKVVKNILAFSHRGAPYIIFGPPGTGKTITLVEAMKQVFRTNPNSHILACAPSNSAASLIAQRLMENIPESQVRRIFATSYNWKEVPENIKNICFYNKEFESFYIPNKKELMKYRIIVSTMCNAGKFVTANFPSGHFTHVFLDEAGHSVEPEAMVPIAGILDSIEKGQLILAGDPKQLGPIVRSGFANRKGLGKSYLERLMEMELYLPKEKGSYNANYITKLVRNYRSHPDIMKVPNELFYACELESWADEMLRNSLCNLEILPKKGFPLIFHGIQGKDKQEASSPSYFNQEEIEKVIFYVQQLVTTKSLIKPSDIGIITPYRAQVHKIRQVLQRKVPLACSEITVGCTEEFQGQERKVIIISTVRSNMDLLETVDVKFQLGFVQNPKRFNVAITRAKALLICIGNPRILGIDVHWRRLIEFIKSKGGSTGSSCTFDFNKDCLLDTFSKMKLNDNGLEVSAKELHENPAWRDDD